MGTGSRGLWGADPVRFCILRAGRVARADGLRIMSAAAWMDTHSVAEINRENGYRVRFPASGSQTDEQQSLASRYQARPALANTSEEAMTDFNAAKELGYAQAMVEVAMLISQHVRRRTLDAETLMVLMDEIRKVQDAHKSEAA